MTGNVYLIHEVKKPIGNDGWILCFQYGRYVYEDGTQEEGYRFIWRYPDGKQQGARGQARIPSLTDAQDLIKRAIEDGWGNLTGAPPITRRKVS